MISALIIDDEIEAREGLTLLLERESDFKLIGTSRDGEEAEQQIRSLKPDLVFLDVQMPGKNGFEVLASLAPDEIPFVVFISAYDEYALDAFRVHALDYIQKPFTDHRFAECLDHVRAELENRSLRSLEGLKNLMKELQNHSEGNPEKHQLKFRSSGKIYFMDTDDIIWVEGFDYYIKVHTKEKFYLVRESLSRIIDQLPLEFIRIHKSTIINKNHLISLEPLSRGNYQAELKNGKQLVMSKTYKDKLDLF
ncbi:LytR/AlgR family response regulator transcription factor [Ekhidna sp. To15]|uniref:LytR/AlgR family response regulator transcription factor n=1 Tax=Ekhidna sp. To15 TaxID=3395267 RepID=UPI003F528FDB